jgi:ankyrin repeat protein
MNIKFKHCLQDSTDGLRIISMKKSCLVILTLSMSMTAYSMHVSWLGKLKPVVSRAASVAFNYVKEHKYDIVCGVVAAAAVALYANKIYKKHVLGQKFRDAIRTGNEQEVRVLLEAGVDPNFVADDYYSEPLLHAAVRSGNVAIVQLLCDYGANKDRTWLGSTPLHMAEERGYTDIVRTLAQAGANIETVDRYGHKPLHRAVLNGNTKIVLILVQAGANKEAVDREGYTALHLAVISFFIKAEIVRILVQAGANKEAADRQGRTPLLWAVLKGNTDIVRILVQAGANTEAVFGDGRTLRDLAEVEQHHEIIEYLDSLPQKEEQMYAAAQCVDIERVKELVAQGAPVWPGIVAAIREYKPEKPTVYDDLAGFLMKTIGVRQACRARNSVGQSLLHIAADRGNKRIATVLLSNGSDVNAADHQGNTPLHLASSVEMSTFLLQHGARLDIDNAAGKVPFSTQIGQWQPHFRKWVEEDQKIPDMFMLKSDSAS